MNFSHCFRDAFLFIAVWLQPTVKFGIHKMTLASNLCISHFKSDFPAQKEGWLKIFIFSLSSLPSLRSRKGRPAKRSRGKSSARDFTHSSLSPLSTNTLLLISKYLVPPWLHHIRLGGSGFILLAEYIVRLAKQILIGYGNSLRLCRQIKDNERFFSIF